MKYALVSLVVVMPVLALIGCAGEGFDGTMFGTEPCTGSDCITGVWDTDPIGVVSMGCPSLPAPRGPFFANARYELVGDQLTITSESSDGVCNTETLTVTVEGNSATFSEEEELKDPPEGCTGNHTFTRTFTFSEDAFQGSVSDKLSYSGKDHCPPDCSNVRTFSAVPLQGVFACP